MSKKQKPNVAETTEATKESTKKEALPTVEGMFKKAEKNYTDAVSLIMLPHDATTTLKFTKNVSKIVRGDTPESDHVESETIVQNVDVTGEKLNALANQKYGMSKEQLLKTIDNVDATKIKLVGLVTIRAKNSLKRQLNPFDE